MVTKTFDPFKLIRVGTTTVPKAELYTDLGQWLGAEHRTPLKRKRDVQSELGEGEFFDFLREKASGIGAAALRPVWHIFDIINQPLFFVSNLFFAPQDKKLQNAKDNLLHFITLGFVQAPERAKKAASEWILGEKKSDFLSWDTLHRLSYDFLFDPFTYVGRIGGVTRAGKHTTNTQRLGKQFGKYAKLVPGLEKGFDAGDLFRRSLRGKYDDVLGAAKKTKDKFLITDTEKWIQTSKSLQITESFNDISRMSNPTRATAIMEGLYSTSDGLYKESLRMGKNNAEDLVRLVMKNSERFSHRQLASIGLPFARVRAQVGRRAMMKLSNNLSHLVDGMSKLPGGRGVVRFFSAFKDLNPNRGGRFTEWLHESLRDLRVTFAATRNPGIRQIQRVMGKLGLSIDEKSFIMQVDQTIGGITKDAKSRIIQAGNLRKLDGQKMFNVYKKVKPVFDDMRTMNSAAYMRQGAVEMAKINVRSANETLDAINKLLDDTNSFYKESQDLLEKVYVQKTPARLRRQLNKVGVKSMKDLAGLTDESAEAIAKSSGSTAGLIREMTRIAREGYGDLVRKTDIRDVLPKDFKGFQTAEITKAINEFNRSATNIAYKADTYRTAIDMQKSPPFKNATEKILLIQKQMAYTPNTWAPELMENDPLLKTLINAFDDSGKKVIDLSTPDPHVWLKSNLKNRFAVEHEAVVEFYRKALGGGDLPPQIEKGLRSVHIPLTAREVNALIRPDVKWEDVLEEIKILSPERYALIVLHNPDLIGPMGNRVADMFDSKDFKGIKEFFAEDAGLAWRSYTRREAEMFSIEETTKLAIRGQSKLYSELVQEGADLSKWMNPSGLYEDALTVVPERVRKIHQALELADSVRPVMREVRIPLRTYEYLVSINKLLMSPKQQGLLKRAIMRVFDSVNGLWVFTTLARPGFHVRNFVSGVGMNAQYGIFRGYGKVARMQARLGGDDVARWYAKQSKVVIKSGSPDAIEKAGKAVIGRSPLYGAITELDLWDKAHSSALLGTGFVEDVVWNNGRMSQNQLRRAGQRTLKKIQDMQRSVGGAVEDNLRLTHLLGQLEKGKTWTDSIELAKLAHYDYGDLSVIDRGIKKGMPFWAWTRKTIPAQFRVMLSHPEFYAPISHILTEQRKKQIPDSLLPEWMADSVGIEMYKDRNGVPYFFSLGSLHPIGELNKLAINPRQLIENVLAGITPVLKEPIQQMLNKDFFTGRKIQEWYGQKAQFLGRFNVPVRLRHAAFNIMYLKELSRLTQESKRGELAPDAIEKAIKVATGLNLRPLDVAQLRRRYEFDERSALREDVSNFNRMVRNGDEINAKALMRSLISRGYDVDRLLEREMKKALKKQDKRAMLTIKEVGEMVR